MDREQLQTFATIVAEGSFERAAMVLNVSRGAVSQRIKALEEGVAAVLLVRDRPVVATAAGEVLLRHVKAMCMSEQATMTALRPSSDSAALVPVAVAVNADSLATWFPSVLWLLLARRHIAIEVVVDDQCHTLARLMRGEVVGCVSTEDKAASGFLARPLGRMEYRCYATQEFADKHFPQGLSVPAVLRAPAVVFNRKDSLHNAFLRAVFGFSVERYARHFLPEPGALLQALRAGVGYGLVPVMQVQALGESSGLVDLAARQSVAVDLYWHHWEHEPALSEEVTRQVVAQAATLLRPSLPADGADDLEQWPNTSGLWPYRSPLTFA
ncbi:MAG TPA: HTH-type transcriptional regulator ArgP [Burkholderiaceae bacterium]|nr:HTH-type transcriptional regulator ArgP [Burkholderiaceae bacterium]